MVQKIIRKEEMKRLKLPNFKHIQRHMHQLEIMHNHKQKLLDKKKHNKSKL